MQLELERFAQREYLLERDVYAHVVEQVQARTGSQIVYLYRYCQAREELSLVAVSAAMEALLDESAARELPLARAGAWADAIRERRPVSYRGYPAAAASPLAGVDLALQNHVSLPVFSGSEVVAVLGVAATEAGVSDELTASLSELLDAMWPMVEARIAACRERGTGTRTDIPVDEVLETIIRAIAGAMEVREEHSALHQQNVAHLCECIAAEVGMSEFERRGLAIGASIHDIGKITVPSRILAKPDSVSDEEFSVLQTHAEIGADLFRSLQLPWPIVDMIAQHHERLDGSGYPGRLQRDDICEGARIIAIADTYDSVASDRPYRRARGTGKAIEILREGRGRIFDAFLVDAFLRCAHRDPGFGGRYSTP